MDPWNIVICTDLRKPLIFLVPDPSKWTLANLKQETGKKIDVPAENLTFYCNETIVPQDKPLTECSGMRNGIALMVTIKPLRVNVYCPHIDSTLHIDIPRRELDKWNKVTLKTAICFKLGIVDREADNDILAMSGSQSIEVPALTDNCLLTYTRIKQFQFPSPIGADVLVSVPLNITEQFASNRNIYNWEMSEPFKKGGNFTVLPWLSFWTVTIQQLDGSKTNVRLPNPHKMPVFKLREAVKDVLSIDTHQQKLTVRDVVLEDWGEAGALMMIMDYPKFHDGVTVYLVQLVEGIHVKVHVLDNKIKPALPYYVPFQDPANMSVFSASSLPNIPLPRYINIHVPSRFQQKTLFKIMENVTGKSRSLRGISQVKSAESIYCRQMTEKRLYQMNLLVL